MRTPVLAAALLLAAPALASNFEVVLEVKAKEHDQIQRLAQARLEGLGIHSAIFSGKGDKLKVNVAADDAGAVAEALGERGQMWIRRIDERSAAWQSLIKRLATNKLVRAVPGPETTALYAYGKAATDLEKHPLSNVVLGPAVERGWRPVLLLGGEPALREKDCSDITPGDGEIEITTLGEGQRKLDALAGEPYPAHLAIIIDDGVSMVVKISAPLGEGKLSIPCHQPAALAIALRNTLPGDSRIKDWKVDKKKAKLPDLP